MKKNRKNRNFDASTFSSDSLESYLKNWELALADLEKIGALFASVGYLTFFSAANLDTLTILDINNTEHTAEETFVYSQELISIGYSLLWIVSMSRYSEALFRWIYVSCSVRDFTINIELVIGNICVMNLSLKVLKFLI
ncbi:hypothetical protein H9X78_08710 [Clostridium saudiense]|nr:hypothetical protein [Clostridium saudiense]